jgi:hypothetical protein
MEKRTPVLQAVLVLALLLSSLAPALLRAEDTIEKAGMAVEMSAGNMWFLPAKFISSSIGVLSGALSFVVTGGNADLTQQIWQDTLQGPYVITPELAKKSIGERPELSQSK